MFCHCSWLDCNLFSSVRSDSVQLVTVGLSPCVACKCRINRVQSSNVGLASTASNIPFSDKIEFN